MQLRNKLLQIQKEIRAKYAKEKTAVRQGNDARWRASGQARRRDLP